MNKLDANERTIRLPDDVVDHIGEEIAEHTEECQTDEECGYPWKMCYEAEVVDDVVTIKQCHVTWWMVLIAVLVSLVVLITIISCIVVCCCKVCWK